MISNGWVNLSECRPGAELFRSDRRQFRLWAHTISHGQTLLRSDRLIDGTRTETLVDVLFKPSGLSLSVANLVARAIL